MHEIGFRLCEPPLSILMPVRMSAVTNRLTALIRQLTAAPRPTLRRHHHHGKRPLKRTIAIVFCANFLGHLCLHTHSKASSAFLFVLRATAVLGATTLVSPTHRRIQTTTTATSYQHRSQPAARDYRVYPCIPLIVPRPATELYRDSVPWRTSAAPTTASRHTGSLTFHMASPKALFPPFVRAAVHSILCHARTQNSVAPSVLQPTPDTSLLVRTVRL